MDTWLQEKSDNTYVNGFVRVTPSATKLARVVLAAGQGYPRVCEKGPVQAESSGPDLQYFIRVDFSDQGT